MTNTAYCENIIGSNPRRSRDYIVREKKIGILTEEEKLIQKALGTYPRSMCSHCLSLVWADTIYLLNSSDGLSHYMLCAECTKLREVVPVFIITGEIRK